MADTPSSIGTLLAVDQVAKRYGGVVALAGADLSVSAGETHALLGANGAGKSTLVKILTGVVRADSGRIVLAGLPLDPRRPADAHAAGVATVFQDPAFAPDLTIDQNLRLSGVDRRGLAGWLERLELSELDMQERAADVPLPILRLLDLARALAHDPRLLVLDEITAALPGDRVELLFSVMADWRDASDDRAVLFITHRLAEVMRVCDRATVFRDGRTAATLVPAEGGVSDLVAPMLGETLGEALEGIEGDREPGAEPTGDQAADRIGGRIGDRSGQVAGPVVLEARGLRSAEQVNGLDLQVRSGEVVGVIGLEGQGQERLFDVLSGNRPAAAGELLVDGARVRPWSPYDMIRRGVVLVPADRLQALLPQQSLHDNLASALYNRFTRWLSLLPDESARIERTTQRLAIDTRARRQVRRLSGGNQQKVSVGRWLTAGFRTLLCFDPTRGIDLATKEQIYELLRELAADGAAILYYTSELTEVPLVCDRVLVMYGGTVVAELPAADADEAALLNAAHGLGAPVR